MNRDKVAVLIPCYNEALTIGKVVRDFQKVIPDNSRIYVYDNNSTDNTAELATEAGAFVRHEYRQGKGNVIRRMFREIDAECYIIVDGDDTYPAGAAPEMIEKVLSHQCDMVIGDRLSSTYFEENKRLFHNFGNRLVRKSINMLFKSNIKDILTGYRAFSYQFVKTFPVLSEGFEIETEMSIHAIDKNLATDNVVIDYHDRPENSVSKLNTYSDGLKVLRTIWRLFRTYKPLVFYGLISAVLAGISLILFLPVFAEYFRTGFVPRFPTLIVSGFIMIASIQSIFSGMILETINRKNRQDFELELLRLKQEEVRHLFSRL
ncbi:MAG: glycosyltransferase [Oscillospiraceae bacterium]|nr:glycosyltransferase [Oscillospiraceae bacterium]